MAAASCTANVGTTVSGAPTSAGAPTTTVPDFGAANTTAPPTTSRRLTGAELEGLLPTVAEIGPGYVVVPPQPASGNGSDDAWDKATRKACPELVKLYSNIPQVLTVALVQDPTVATRGFTDLYRREVAVDLADGENFISTKERLDDIVAATNSCDPIEVADTETGGTITMTLRASPDSHYGDFGMVMKMKVDRHGGILGNVIVESTGHVRTFQRGQTTVSILTADGFDPTTFRGVPVNYLLASDLAEKLDREIEDLQGH